MYKYNDTEDEIENLTSLAIVDAHDFTEVGQNAVPSLQNSCKQCQAEVDSKSSYSRNKMFATWDKLSKSTSKINV